MPKPDTGPAAAAAGGPPSIPMALQHLPTVGGLVVPWVSARHADGRIMFGSVDRDRLTAAFDRRLCGVCGEPHQPNRLVLLMRLSDLPRRRTSEPPLHPWCASYSTAACPMLGGRMDHYRSSSPPLDDNMSPGHDGHARQGAAAEAWFSVWLAGYRLVTDHGNPAAAYGPEQVLRIRAITWRLPPGF